MTTEEKIIYGCKGVAEYYGITYGKARNLIERGFLPDPIVELDMHSRTHRIWDSKDLDIAQEFIHLTSAELMQVAIVYKTLYLKEQESKEEKTEESGVVKKIRRLQEKGRKFRERRNLKK